MNTSLTITNPDPEALLPLAIAELIEPSISSDRIIISPMKTDHHIPTLNNIIDHTNSINLPTSAAVLSLLPLLILPILSHHKKLLQIITTTQIPPLQHQNYLFIIIKNL